MSSVFKLNNINLKEGSKNRSNLNLKVLLVLVLFTGSAFLKLMTSMVQFKNPSPKIDRLGLNFPLKLFMLINFYTHTPTIVINSLGKVYFLFNCMWLLEANHCAS